MRYYIGDKIKLCKCGCLQYIIFKKHHKSEGIPDFIRGHYGRGKDFSEERKEKIRLSKLGKPNKRCSETRKRLFAEGKMINPMKGRKRPNLSEFNKSNKMRKINSLRQRGNNNSAKREGVGEKISISKKIFYRENPEKHANRIMCKKGFISKPQNIMFEKLKKIYCDAELEYPIKTKVSTRFADVGVPSLKLDFEFDGFKHNNSNDSIRDLHLLEVGWKTIRFKEIKEIYNYYKKLKVITYSGRGEITRII